MRSGGERERKKKSRERERERKNVCVMRERFLLPFLYFFPVENHSVSYFDPNVVNKSSSITSSNE
jgi:hypothetical protein